MAEALIMSMAIGSGLGVTIATLERRPTKEIELWGFYGTTAGFLVGLFWEIYRPDSPWR